MTSTFFGLEIARRGLQAQQRALDVTGHNVSNANTPGYTRQEAVMATTPPYPVPGLSVPAGAGQVGSGVEISEIRRLRDGFLDLQYRGENNALGYWEARWDAIQKVETILNEPSDSGLSKVFEQFWQSLEDLSKNPESPAARSTVLERGKALAETFNYLDRQLQALQKDLDRTIQVKVDEVNSFARQIADLNRQIQKIEVAGQRANDLRDKRDLLLDQLSKDINIQVREDANGMVQVGIGGRLLVEGDRVDELIAKDSNGDGFSEVLWEADPKDGVQVTGGTIRGLIDMRGYLDEAGRPAGLVPKIRSVLDNMAKTLVQVFNHGITINNQKVKNGHVDGCGLDGSTGNTNLFFKEEVNINNAGNIAIADGVLNDLNKIAAAKNYGNSDTPIYDKGDGSNALELAQLLKQEKISDLGNATFEGYYQAAIGELGVQGQQAKRMAENQQLLVSQLDSNRQEVSGVSLDEEMVNMIRFQHAYAAAARVITALDEMLDLIIGRMGLVGR
ncbi:MAG TPA: flagellar hook-associated protein FlgK [Syntrophomonadaceae bacterium]|nr:flagellar hook-associated protein FlgK [Syntrophomonadaceae bacterium]